TWRHGRPQRRRHHSRVRVRLARRRLGAAPVHAVSDRRRRLVDRADVRANRNLAPPVLGGMLLESIGLALVFGVVVGGLTAALLGYPPPPMVVAFTAQHLGRWTMLMLSIGAGIYEELLFRVVLVGLLAWGATKLLG